MSYLRAEGAMRSSVWAELPAYHVANGASEALLWVIKRAGVEPVEDEKPPAGYWRAKALLYLGVIAVRTTRAAMAVIACGYEAETMGFKRTLMEVQSRGERVVNDESGEYARQWLQARAGKPARAVSGFAPDDLFEMLSHSSHADHRGVENFLAVSEPDGSTRLLTVPERRPEVSNATLIIFASETRDVAVLIANERGLTIPHLAELDAAISTHPYWSENQSDEEATESPPPSGMKWAGSGHGS
jgi:hypothetical protein